MRNYEFSTMNFLMLLFDAIAAFVRRNPITCLVILLLAVAAPSVLQGVAVFILYFVLSLVVLTLVVVLLFRWRMTRLRRQMEEQFGGRQGFDPFAAEGRRQNRSSERREGEVKIHKTAGTPEKRVSNDVGDYVDFEETKD